jgi:hypothetical protein
MADAFPLAAPLIYWKIFRLYRFALNPPFTRQEKKLDGSFCHIEWNREAILYRDALSLFWF